MRWSQGSHRWVTVVGLFALNACRQNTQHETKNGGLNAEQPCTRHHIAVRAVPEDSFPRAERCRLLDLAIKSVGEASPASGLVPTDTTAISSALLVPLSQTTPEGLLIRARWHVSLTLDRRPYDAEVIVARSSGQVTVSRIHKPL